MWICPICGEEIDRVDHIVFIEGLAGCRPAMEEEFEEWEEGDWA